MPAHHFTIEVIASNDRVIGYRCADAGCRAMESVLERRERVEAERAHDEAKRAREARRARQRELVAWRCVGDYDSNGVTNGCGIELRLMREDAEAQSYCCVACRRRCQRALRGGRALPPPCAECAMETTPAEQNRRDRDG